MMKKLPAMEARMQVRWQNGKEVVTKILTHKGA